MSHDREPGCLIILAGMILILMVATTCDEESKRKVKIRYATSGYGATLPNYKDSLKRLDQETVSLDTNMAARQEFELKRGEYMMRQREVSKLINAFRDSLTIVTKPSFQRRVDRAVRSYAKTLPDYADTIKLYNKTAPKKYKDLQCAVELAETPAVRDSLLRELARIDLRGREIVSKQREMEKHIAQYRNRKVKELYNQRKR